MLATFDNEIKLDLRNLRYCCGKNTDDVIVTSLIELWRPNLAQWWFLWQLQRCAKFHCPSSTETLFSGGRVQSNPPFIESQKSPAQIGTALLIFIPLRQFKAIRLVSTKLYDKMNW